MSRRTRRPSTRSLRSRVSWSATAVVAGWVVVLAVGANAVLGVVLGRQADGVLRARAEAAATTVRVDAAGRVEVAEVPDDRALDVGTWIFAADGRTVEAPARSTSGLDRRAAALAGPGRGTSEVGLGDPVRLLALPVVDAGVPVATVVTSTSLAPYRQVERLALLSTAAAALLLLALVHLVLRVSITRALRPVQQMSAQAGRWSAEHVDRRFGVAPRPAELADLAGTLDAVLDRLAAVVRHEQRLTAELSHELRTPLARAQTEVDWLRRRPRGPQESEASLAGVDEALEAVRSIIETLVSAARTGATTAPGRCLLAGALVPAVAACGHGRSGTRILLDVDPSLAVGAEAAVVQRIVSPVLENAVRYARSTVTVTASRSGAAVRVTVEDDGPGVPQQLAGRVLEPGFRGDPGDGHDGAGLGLALAHRLATAAGGGLAVLPAPGAGRFTISLPPA